MNQPSTSVLEVLGTAVVGNVKLEVLGARQLHVPKSPEAAYDPWPHVGRLQVRNLAASPIVIEYSSGSIGHNTFRGEVMEPGGQAIPAHRGPTDPTQMRQETVSLSPGEKVLIHGDPTYIMDPLGLTRGYEDASGAKVTAEGARNERRFEVTFHVNLGVRQKGKESRIEQVFPTQLTILLDGA